MPGNELDDRVHNFFAQDNSLQGQHHSQAVEGNWPVLNSNFWVGSHRQDNSLNSSNVTYNSQNSETDRGAGSYPHHVTHGLNFTQSNLRPDFAKSQSLNEQQNSNGFMYENQFSQSRQNEANFQAMDRNSTQRHFITSKGLSAHELRQSGGTDHLSRASVRSGTPESPVNFDLFGAQQQRSHQQSIIQSPGINNMQQLQQQLMIRKMQEFHRQQQLQHLDLRQQNSNNEVNPFAKPTCISQSSFVYGAPNSDTLHHPWATECGPNWMNQGSPTLQGSPSGYGFQPNLGQTQRLVDLVPQQVDQSLYGVPVSSSKGLSANQYSQMMAARSSMPQMPMSSSHRQGNELSFLADQVGVQNEPTISRHKVPNENTFGFASGINTGMRNMGGLQLVNSISRSVLQQDFLGRQEVAVRPETSHETLSRQVASPQNDVALDPAEEKILFGSDDNIWDAFGNSPHMSGESGNAFDNGGLSNGLPSIQSGSWSALMQSAVAETSSSDIVPQEEWSGLILHKNDDLSRGQLPLARNGCSMQQASLNENIHITSALNSESFPTSNDIGTANTMGLNQFGEKFQNEPRQMLQTDMSGRFVQSLEESGKRPNSGPLHHLVSERSQICGETSQRSFLAETSPKPNSPSWMPGQNGTGLQSNGWNPQAAVPPRGDRVTITHDAEKLKQNFQNSEVRMMQGDTGHKSSLWNSNSVPSSAIKLGRVNSRVGNREENQGILSSEDASVAKSCNAQMSDKTSSYVENSYLLNQWKNAHSPARSQDGRSLGRLLHQANDLNQVLESTKNHEKGEIPRNEMGSCDGKENSNDSHHSNLSQHTSGGFRESGLSDASDSQAFPTGKQKSTNQLPRKVSASRKFHYHPMNLDEDADVDAKPTYDLKQYTHLQAMSQQNAHFGQSKIFGQIPRNSTVKEKGQSSELHRDTSCTAKESLHGNYSGHTPNAPLSISRTTDAHTSKNASLSSQNMLELLHKVDQSGNHDAMMQFRSSERNSSSGQPEAENSDGFGCLQHSQSFVSQGFGLQLGPPSQKLRVLDHSVSSQNDQGTFSSSTAAGMGDKGQQPSRSVQSLPTAEEAKVDFGLSRSATAVRGSNDSSLYKTPENFISALHSGTPHSKGIIQHQQIARVSGQMPMTQHMDSVSGNASHPAQRRSSETLLPDASSSFQLDNLPSSGGKYRQSRPDDVTERFQTDSTPNSDQEKTSRQFSIPGISRQGNSAQYNMRTNVTKLQHNMGIQFQQISRIPESPLPNIVESSSASLMQGYVNSEGVAANGGEQRLKEGSGQAISSSNMDTDTKMVKSLGKTPSIKQLSDDSPPSSTLKQKDVDPFGQSLKFNSSSHQNSLSQSQMEVLKGGETDSDDRASKRMRGLDKIEDVLQGALSVGGHNEHSAVVGGSIGSSSGPQTENCKGLDFSRPLDMLQRKVSHQGNVALDDSSGINRDVSQSFSCSDHITSVRADQPQVSPQLAQSWFSRYGTFSNGQMFQIHGAHHVAPIKPGETPFAKASCDLDLVSPEVRGTAPPSDAYQMNSSNQTSSLVVNGHFTSPRPPQLNITGQHQVVLRPIKQTKASPGLHPWHKEISQDSQDLWSLSMAEAEWNKAANHLTQKVEDDAESIEDGPPVLRSKRRLILTSHLMQQLLRPAPANVICADASHGYENLAYHVSRTALGDACSMACRSSNLDIPCDNMDLLLAKGELPERNGCLSHAKATEELMERARKLEYDLLRLDKSASILDLRLEYQELEKFSIINRFAKFHGRGQSDNTETASVDVKANTQKYIPQRYVTALAMPKTLPDGVQCLSL